VNANEFGHRAAFAGAFAAPSAFREGYLERHHKLLMTHFRLKTLCGAIRSTRFKKINRGAAAGGSVVANVSRNHQFAAQKILQCAPIGSRVRITEWSPRMHWKFLLVILVLGLSTGFAIGYGVRASISNHRRALAARYRR